MHTARPIAHARSTAEHPTGAAAKAASRFLLESFLAHAVRSPQDTALLWQHTETSYGELHRRAVQARQRLAELGLDTGDRRPVGVLAAKSPDAIALVLALLSTGRPFLLPAPGLADRTLAALFAKAGCAAVLSTDTGQTPYSADLVDHVIEPAAVDLPDQSIGSAGVPALSPPADTGADAITFMLTTSGSTGVPKVVPLTASAIGLFAAWAGAQFAIGPQRTVLNYAPLNFDLCLLDIWTTLAMGGRVVLVEAEHATRAEHLRDLLERYRVNVVQAVPMLYQLLGDAAAAPLESVDQVISTGDALPPRCLAELPRLFPNARLYNLYGCTETNDSFLHEIDATADQDKPIPLGQPIPGVDALLLDEFGAVLDGPGVGELHVATPFQTPGYLDPVLDAGRFVQLGTDPDAPRYFRSGDLVRRHPDGTLTLEGRNDFQVKVRGVRVNTHEVEQVLLEHAEVREAVVFALPDPLAGSALHAVVHRADPAALNSLIVRRHCATRLPLPAIPSTIRLVDGALPRTSTGKPDRNLLKQSHLKEG